MKNEERRMKNSRNRKDSLLHAKSYAFALRVIGMNRYGLLEGRECIMGGVRARSIMGCDNLVRPRVTAAEAVCLGAVGFDDAIMPERRIELSVYLAAKALRG